MRRYAPGSGREHAPQRIGSARIFDRYQEDAERERRQQRQANSGNQLPAGLWSSIESQEPDPGERHQDAHELQDAWSFTQHQTNQDGDDGAGRRNGRDDADHSDGHSSVDGREADQAGQPGDDAGGDPGAGRQGDAANDDHGGDQQERRRLRDEENGQGAQAPGLEPANEITDAPAEAGGECQQNRGQ